ncbi:MAG: ABC transporter ATP-binding protein/permease [Deinococcales bacterium]
MKNLRRLYLGEARAKTHLLLLGAYSFAIGALGLVQWWAVAQMLWQGVFVAQALALSSVLIAAAALLLRALLQGLRERTANAYALLRAQAWRNQLAQMALAMRHNPEATQSALEQMNKLEAYCARFMPSAVHMLIVPGVVLVFAFWLDVTTALVFAITAPLIPLLMWLIGVGAKQHIDQMYARMQQLGQHFADILRGLEDLQAINRSRIQREGIAKASLGFAQATLQALRVAFLNGFAMELTATIATALVAVLAGTRLLQANLSFSVAMLAILLCAEFYNPIRQFGLEHHTAMEAAPVAELFVVQQPTPHTTVTDRRFSLRQVEYTYPNASSTALQIDNLEFGTGLYALVGASGSGKTTLLRLLLGELEPQVGHVLCGSAARWSRAGMVAFVGQQPHFWNASIFDNLLLAKPDAREAAMYAALEAAGALDFVAGLPDGIHTQIGERGLRLSGGERQRLALARAFLQDAPLVLFDEATSSLDRYTQSLVQDAIARLAQTRTVVLVAHRLETVVDAREIIVLRHGLVVQRGTHAVLSQQAGEYQNLWRLHQARKLEVDS